MSYRIRPKDPDMSATLRRIAEDRLNRAIEATKAETAETRMPAVHDIRKRLKEMRALLRLVRPDFDDFKQVDRALRDIGRELSALRDINVRCDTLGHLADYVDLPDDPLAPYLAELTRSRDTAYGPASDSLLATTRTALIAMRDASAHWRLRHNGRKAIFPGLSGTYADAREAMGRARETRAPEDFHEWRKHVKYHFYHAQILSPIWPEAMEPHIAAAEALGELLGQHHDLIVLGEEARAAGLPAAPLAVLEAGLHDRITALEKQAFLDGARLLADSPEALSRRWSVWYRLWRHAN
jgi:Uncharacterized conserved protein